MLFVQFVRLVALHNHHFEDRSRILPALQRIRHACGPWSSRIKIDGQFTTIREAMALGNRIGEGGL